LKRFPIGLSFGQYRLTIASFTITTPSVSARSSAWKSRPARTGVPIAPKYHVLSSSNV
jgi:hypothetical protein